MPREVLRESNEDAYTGFFGKLPVAGDFLSRGLAPAFRAGWDAWITRHLGARKDAAWPAGGLRFRLESGGRAAGGVILPSVDAAGRAFPLSLVMVAPSLPDPPGLDPWCDLAVAAAGPALAGVAGPDDLWSALPDAALTKDPTTAGAPFVLWTRGKQPLGCPADRPEEAIAALFADAEKAADDVSCWRSSNP